MSLKKSLSGWAGKAILTSLCFITITVLLCVPVHSSDSKYKEDKGKYAYNLIFFDGHMHTVESDGSGSLEDIKIAALNRGLSSVIVTNHTKQITLDEWNDMERRSKALSDKNFLMINGFEVTGSEGMFNRDHVLAWNVRDPFVGDDMDELAPEEIWESPKNPEGTGALYPENIREWINYIHEQGGLAVHAHTSGTTNPVYGVDCIEIFNLSNVKDVAYYATLLGYPEDDAYGLGLVFNNFALYGERDLSMPVAFPGIPFPIPLRDALYQASLVFSGTGEWLGNPQAPLHSWDNLLMMYINGKLEKPIFGVANSDAHNTYNIEGHDFTGASGDTYGDYSNDYSDVGETKNGIFVKKLSRGQLFSAIKHGRFFATTGPSMHVTLNGKMMGETANINPCKEEKAELSFSVSAQSPSAAIVRIDIIKNGQILQIHSPMAPAYETIIEDAEVINGYYRIEVTTVDMADNSYGFAYSNPIFVKSTTK